GEAHYPTQVAGWSDYDNDGDLDLFVGNETNKSFRAPCQLFQNQGNGTFVDVAATAGVQNFGFTKGVAWGDFNGDRFPDLFVSNYEEPNRFYLNQGDGTFREAAAESGVLLPSRSFPAWSWDYDNDGKLDLFVSSYHGKTANVLKYHCGQPLDLEITGFYRGDGTGKFTSQAKELRVDRPILPMGTNFGDLNNDGYLDFYLGTGNPNYETLVPNLMFLSQGAKEYVDVTMAGGFGHLQKGHGIAFADLDDDGDQDVFEQMGGAFPGDKFRNALFENPGFGNGFLRVKLVGTKSNRSAIGARIRADFVDSGTSRTVYRHIGSGGSFGCNPLREHIGIGKATIIDRLEVYWPTSDTTQVFTGISSGASIVVTEGSKNYASR
ncbi:MAG: CRTAC1 family protein, partial [Planctomycetota bacterium]